MTSRNTDYRNFYQARPETYDGNSQMSSESSKKYNTGCGNLLENSGTSRRRATAV